LNNIRIEASAAPALEAVPRRHTAAAREGAATLSTTGTIIMGTIIMGTTTGIATRTITAAAPAP
jgi:hypothetical protein